MLSSLSGSISTFLRHGTAVEEREELADAPDDYEGQTDGPVDPASHPAPHTPEQHSSSSSNHRLSPNSLSASGSEIMSGVLSAHPHFSVFRKRGGSGQTSREEDVADSPSGNGNGRGGFSVKDLQDDNEDEAVETLVTPPNQSPNSSARAPGATAGAADGNASSDSSFHLSLDSGDMPSLNFGEASSLSLSPSNSPRGPSPRSRSTSPSASTYAPRTASPLSAVHTPDQSGTSMSGGVRLVPDSPPQTRTPARQSFSRSSSTSTLDRSERRAASTNKMRSSTGAGPVQRVQFSPLSLCPSPLMNAPPPPPPPPPPFSLDDEALTSLGTPPATVSTGRGILKLPKTPGTGRSVRFSASTVRRSPLATDSVPLPAGGNGEGEEGREYEDEEEGEEEGMENSPSIAPGGRSLSRSGRARGEVEEVGIEDEEGREEGEEGGGADIIRQEVVEEEQEEQLFQLNASSSFSNLPSTAPFAPVGGDDSSLLISSTLLSRLQAIAPSPDVSLVSPPPATSAPLPSISVGQATPSSAHQQQQQRMGQEGKDASLLLFDESNPFLGQSHSHLHSHSHSHSHSQLDPANLASSTTSSSASSAVQLESSASVLLIDSSLPLNLVDTSLATINGGGPSFGGESFAQVSYLHHPLGVARPTGGKKARLEEIGEEEEEEGEEPTAEYSAATTILPPSASPATAARTPRPFKSTTSPPSSPHFPQAPSSAARSDHVAGSPLRASDLSSVAPEGEEEEEAEQSRRTAGRRSASPSPPPGYDSLSPPTTSTATFSSPSPTCIAPSPAAASPARSTSSAPATGLPVGGGENNLSFYRLFMSSRASLRGGSTAAREEWGRLERGEKGSPRDASTSSTSSYSITKQGRGDGEVEVQEEGEPEEQEGVGEESVYWSPRKEGSVDFEEADEGEGEEEEGGIRVVAEGEEAGEEAAIDGLERMRASFLSPIVEVSEPESNANTPFDPSASTTSRRPTLSGPLPPQPSFATALQQSLSVSAATTPAPPATPSRKLSSSRAPSTPLSASKIPRPRNPITPSQNPFLLQLARAPHPAGSTAGAAAQKGAALLSDLFSAQQDQLATSHSQRFILSSLVTNLQNEVEHKEKMVDNLKRQVEQAREEAREVEQLALEWEERFRQATSTSSSSMSTAPSSAAETPSASSARHDRKKIHALEETIQLLADELETRVQEDRAHRHRLEVELDDARADLLQRDREVREGDIRLRYAQEEALRAVEEGRRTREEEGKVKEEMEGLRARWKVEVEERDEAVRLLREELLDLKKQQQQSGDASVSGEADIEKEVARRVAVALEDSARETALVKHELVQRDAALASLRESTRQQREEIDRLAQAVQTERQQAELAHSDMVAALEAREEELARAQEAQVAAQDEADEALARLEAAETERDRMSDTLRAKEDQLAQQVEQNRSALDAMAELETHVQRIAGDLAVKEDELKRVKREMDQQRREAEDVLEKRDRVLAESEKLAGKAKRELEGVQKENNRLNDLVGKLRRDSADREVKITKLKKRAAELEEDVFGLNIALDAKQQEASHWKRQMSTLKHDRERAAAAASSLADSTASAFPSTVSRSTFAPVSAASTVRRSTSTLSLVTASKAKQHATTPHPTDKTKPAPSRRVSVSSRPSSAAISASSATETEDDVEASHDLTLPPADYEKTPSRAPSNGMRKSSSTAVFSSVGAGVPSRKSSSSALSRGRRSSSLEGEAKENAPPVQGREGRRREAVLA